MCPANIDVYLDKTRSLVYSFFDLIFIEIVFIKSNQFTRLWKYHGAQISKLATFTFPAKY